jgi:hypothetical protein
VNFRSQHLTYQSAMYSTTSWKFWAENLWRHLSFENWYCHIFSGPFVCIWQFVFHFTFLTSTVCFSAFNLSLVPSLPDNYTFSLAFLTCSCSLIPVFLWSFNLLNFNDIFVVCAAPKLCLYLLFKTHILLSVSECFLRCHFT